MIQVVDLFINIIEQDGMKELKHFAYDSQGNLIEEIEIWNPEENRFQKKGTYIPQWVFLQKVHFSTTTLLWHFSYEYFLSGYLVI